MTQQPQLRLLLLLHTQISIARRLADAAASTASNQYDVGGTSRGTSRVPHPPATRKDNHTGSNQNQI